MSKMIATRNGVEMYEVGYTGQHGISYPWTGKTHSTCEADTGKGEIAAANVYESPNGNDCVLVRWAVVKAA
jgi:hypothetical protein